MFFCQRLVGSLAVGGGLLAAAGAWGQETRSCSAGAAVATVIALDGDVVATETGGAAVRLLPGAAVCPGDRIVTGDASGVDIRFDAKDSVTNILSNSSIVIAMPREPIDVTLVGGLMRFLSSVRTIFVVRTPRTDAGIDGTEAMLYVTGPNRATLVLMREGVITETDRIVPTAKLRLGPGQASYSASDVALRRATADAVPAVFRPYLLAPERAADWAVYYPPILLASRVSDPVVLRAARLLDAGEPAEADTLLRGYSGGDPAAALALRAMIAVFTNRPADGLALAGQALAADAGLGAAHVALSYALQAAGRVDDARDAAERATRTAPSDAYAWARLAELELTIGNRRAARAAVERSLAIAPTALAHAVHGFALLSASENDAARTAFRAAIDVESEAPLPRLGLGLAMINDGELAAGRRELEAAASLDPQRAQLRGWLGRAYLAEGLNAKALAQFRLAEEMDPDDPTAWLFEAEGLYIANRPVEALAAADIAEDKGAGRATLRGRDGLGEDAAARATAAGRIFDVLGFEDQAVQAGARAVAADPTNPGAHEFLADIYRARPGFEIAQGSERLVADLLRGPTNAPIQLELSEADLVLNTGSGAARVTFHEFSPLLTPDGFRALVAGGLGTNGTWNDNVSLTLKDGKFSMGIAQYHSETDGFVDNNDVRHDIIALQIRAEPVPGVSLFGEVKGRRSEWGDLRLTAAGTVEPNLRNEWERDSIRLGAHVELTDWLDFIGVGTIASTKRRRRDSSTAFGLTADTDNSTETTGGDLQLKLIGRQGPVRFEIGGSLLVDSGKGTNEAGLTYAANPFLGCFLGGVQIGAICNLSVVSPVDVFDRHYSAYGYAHVDPADWVSVTVGGAIEHLETGLFEETVFNPKVAIILKPYDGVVLRGAYLHTLKRPYILDQTIEPTTLGGFNQFFDDESGTKARMIAGGIDLQPFDNVWIGGEVAYRDLETPVAVFNAAGAGTFDSSEWRARGYANVTFLDRFAFSTGVELIDVETDLVRRTGAITTLLVPVSLSYFHPSGVFGNVTGTWLSQEITDTRAPNRPTTSDSGILVDLTLGYRLPNQAGLFTLEVLNVFDTDLAIQDEITFNARPLTDTIARERVFMARFTVPLN